MEGRFFSDYDDFVTPKAPTTGMQAMSPYVGTPTSSAYSSPAYAVSQQTWDARQNAGVLPEAAKQAAPVGMLAAAGGPLGMASMGLQAGASIFDAYQKYKAQKAQERLNKQMQGRMTEAYNRDERLLALADKKAEAEAIRNQAAIARSTLERYAQRGSKLAGV